MILLALAIAAAPHEPIPWRQALEICRTFHLEDQAKGRAMWRALSKEARDSVTLTCLTYRQGVIDAREAGKGK